MSALTLTDTGVLTLSRRGFTRNLLKFSPTNGWFSPWGRDLSPEAAAYLRRAADLAFSDEQLAGWANLSLVLWLRRGIGIPAPVLREWNEGLYIPWLADDDAIIGLVGWYDGRPPCWSGLFVAGRPGMLTSWDQTVAQFFSSDEFSAFVAENSSRLILPV